MRVPPSSRRLLAIAVAGVAASAVSCASLGAPGSRGTATTAPPAPPPAWYLQPPRDSDDSLFGVGAAGNLPAAKSAALVDIAARLAVSVRSAYQERTSQTNGTLDERIERELEARVGDHEFRGYEVRDTAYAEGHFYALVRVDRAQLLQDVTGAYKRLDAEITSRLEAARDLAPLQYCVAFRGVHGAIERASAALLVIQSLDPAFDASGDLMRYLEYRETYERARSLLAFTVYVDESSLELGEVVQELLSREGFPTDLRTEQGCEAICVEVSTTEVSRYAARRYMSTVSAVFRVREASGSVAATREHRARGTALAGEKAATRAALRKFRAGFAEQGILNVLGL